MYKLTKTDTIVRIEDGAFIPADPANGDYQAYLAWREQGNLPEPYTEPPPLVPQEVTPFQAREAMARTTYIVGQWAQPSGQLLDAVEALVADPSTPGIIRRAWEYGTVVRRTSESVSAMGAILGLSEEEKDQLFILAAGIEA